jgi:dual specificity phosphatase 3
MTDVMPGLGKANAHWVTEFLAVGGDLEMYDAELAAQQAADLVGAGVTHVLDVRLEADDAELWAMFPEVTYLWHGIDDAGQVVPDEWWESIVSWSLEALSQPGAKLLTHCHMGINRGPSAGYGVLLGLGWDPVNAIDTIRSARPEANVWYAEDALRWRHHRVPAADGAHAADLTRLRDWREQNPLDVVRVIAEQRKAVRPA